MTGFRNFRLLARSVAKTMRWEYAGRCGDSRGPSSGVVFHKGRLLSQWALTAPVARYPHVSLNRWMGPIHARHDQHGDDQALVGEVQAGRRGHLAQGRAPGAALETPERESFRSAASGLGAII